MIEKFTWSGPYRKSLSASWKEGSGAAIMIAIADYYVIPMALVLGADVREIGLLVAFPHLIGSIAQVYSPDIVRRVGSRLKMIVRGTFLQASLLLTFAALPLADVSGKVEIFIILMIVFSVMGNLIGTVWGSVVSDYLSAGERAGYLGWRTKVTGITGLLGLFAGGLILWFFKRFSPEFAFAILFLVASASRFFSSFYMSRMEDLPLRHGADVDFTFFQFLRRFRESNFVKFVLFAASLTFSVNLAAPFFNVHMLQNLHLSYLEYTIVHMTAVVTGLLTVSVWGRHADRVGNAKILKTTSLFIPILPLPWVFMRHVPEILIVQFIGGILWAGYNLACVNYIFDAVTPEKRVRCLSYFNFINGIMLSAGAATGGWLSTHLPPIGGYRLATIFLISGLARLACHFLLSGRFREIRESAQKVSSFELFFSVIGIRPLVGPDREIGVITPRADARRSD